MDRRPAPPRSEDSRSAPRDRGPLRARGTGSALGRRAGGARIVERAPYRESAYALLMQALAARREHRRGHAGVRPPADAVARRARDAPAPAHRCAARPAAGRRRGGARGRAVAPLPGPLARAAARPFVARADEVQRLRRSWAAARRGEARMALLAGEPGIGKTSLAAHLALEAHDEGGSVLLGRCHPEALVPYEPFVEALRQLPDSTLREDAAVLARVMPELAPSDAPQSGGFGRSGHPLPALRRGRARPQCRRSAAAGPAGARRPALGRATDPAAAAPRHARSRGGASC